MPPRTRKVKKPRNGGTVKTDEERSNKEGRHVGLDFYDLLIEGHFTQNPCGGHDEWSREEAQ
jgi:hypothetical protein